MHKKAEILIPQHFCSDCRQPLKIGLFTTFLLRPCYIRVLFSQDAALCYETGRFPEGAA